MQTLVSDAVKRGAEILMGGSKLDRVGHFFAPTVLANVPEDALVMNEEPFGPIAPLVRFKNTDTVIRQANRLSYGLASYVFTNSIARANQVSNELESGLVYINRVAVLADMPFGGIKDSGIGSEGGTESFDTYLNTKYIMQG